MSNWEKLLLDLELYGKLDRANESQSLLYIIEELGELARVLNENNGLKKAKSTESKLYECADTIIASIGTFFKLGGTQYTLLSIIEEKSKKWKENLICTQNVKFE